MADTRPRSPVRAAALSFLFPGLGEWWAGAHRRGLLIATPALIVLVAIIGFAIGTALGGGASAMVDLILRPEVLVGIVVLDLLALAYHLGAIVDAWLVARRTGPTSGRRQLSVVAVVGLIAILGVTTVVHGSVASLGVDTEDTLATVFPDDPTGEWAIPDASFGPDNSPDPGTATPGSSPVAGVGATASPTTAPTATPVPVPAWAKDGRLNLLLVGSDAGKGRWLLRTDTMLVLSVDIATGRAAMFGIPRNLINVPLPAESAKAFSNGQFPGLLNALYVYAIGHPSQFPGGDARGFRAVTGAIQQLVGVKLDAFVAVDLSGFVKLVDAVGGLRINVPSSIHDDRYPKVDGSGYATINIKAGCQKLSGGMALAYARSRHQDSDYGRMGRQQAVLLALRRQLDPLDLLPRVPQLLSIAKNDLWTTVKRSDIAALAQLASKVNASTVQKVLFVPGKYPEVLTTGEIKKIRGVVRNIFDGPAPKPSSSSSGGKACS